jgi:hypothetical protein
MELIRNNFYTILLRGSKSVLSGILLCEGLEWILLKYVPVDYVLDGYMLIRTRYIKKIERKEEEIFNESVIRLKLIDKEFDKSYPELDEISNILYCLLQEKIVIQLVLHDDTVCYIGKIKKLFSKMVRIQNLDSKGNWENESSYPLERIRTIQFDNDYINSLIAYNKWLNISNKME